MEELLHGARVSSFAPIKHNTNLWGGSDLAKAVLVRLIVQILTYLTYEPVKQKPGYSHEKIKHISKLLHQSE